MKQQKYLWTLYLIITTIVISIATQIFFNYKNYQKNKQQFINEVQISLDNATDVYYSELVKREFKITKNNGLKKTVAFTFFDNSEKSTNIDSLKILSDSIFNSLDVKIVDSLILKKTKNGIIKDSIKIFEGMSSILISITQDDINLKKLKKIIGVELKRKKIKLPFKINHYLSNKLLKTSDSITTYKNPIKTTSKSTYLKENEKLEIEFPNQTKTYLKRGLLGILLSLILSIAIIASLFYLLNIIKKQKAVAEIKNDFISNITHEFKTPITTIGLALEGIKNFSDQGKKQKTKEYLNITNNQLQKLTVMVEKVLDTATLDSENLLLHKESINVIELIEKIITKYKISHPEKELTFSTNTTKEILQVDAFHFENAINNIIDNAYKYGGNLIEVVINSTKESVIINISDSGSIPKNQRQNIFDKFYRIPQGNQHDVKGFGIGLYYAKKIIEKHHGSIELLATDKTQFKITLPK